MKSKLKPYFLAALKPGGTLELSIYEEIGASFYGEGVTAASVKAQLDATGIYSRIALRINSPGGDAFEGVAIGNLLRAQKKPIDVYIDGIAASAASIIAMAGDTITVASNSIMMFHNAWTMCVGEGKDMRKMADTLDLVSGSIAQTYVERTGKTLAEVTALMDAETWMNADQCLANGFATAKTEKENRAAMALATSFKSALERFEHVPDQLLNDMAADCTCDCQPCTDGMCTDCNHMGCDSELENCTDCPMDAEPMAKVEPVIQAAEESNISLYEARLRMLRQP